MTWWVWILLGLALLGVEVAIPGGIILVFFGVSALLVGVLKVVGLAGPVWFQWFLFSALSIVSLVTLRTPIMKKIAARAEQAGTVDSVKGEGAVPMEDLAPDGLGKVEFRGTSWNARNIGARPLVKGQRCVVDRVEGLTLFIKES
ncbi:MAG: NfeD family protein [Acidobacteriota bacterium]